jgi:SsrA-binding protein
MGRLDSDKNNRTVATNRKARHDYAIDQVLTAGMVLVGSEVKSLRDGKVSMREGHVDVRGGEAFLLNVHIQEYPFANQHNHPPLRPRKLLLNRGELRRLHRLIAERGCSAVPLRLFLKRGRFKLDIGIGKGKRRTDKRQELKSRQAAREVDRALKEI